MADNLDTTTYREELQEDPDFISKTYREELQQDPDFNSSTFSKELTSDTDFNPSTYKQEVLLHSGKLGARPRPEQVPKLVSVDNLETEYLKNLYLAHFSTSKSSNINSAELLFEAKQLENTAISRPIDDATLKTFAELITRAIKMFKTPRTEPTKKERIFHVILKCSSILLNFAPTSFDQLVQELEHQDITDKFDIWIHLIVQANEMYEKVNIEDPKKEAYLKYDIFFFIKKCCDIMLKYETLSFDYAIDIADTILQIVETDVVKAYTKLAQSQLSGEDKIQNWKDVKEKLQDAKRKYNTLYINFVKPIEYDEDDIEDDAKKSIKNLTRLEKSINHDIWIDLITQANNMYVNVREEDPKTKADLKNEIFFLIKDCCDIMFKTNTLSFDEALGIAYSILKIIVDEVAAAYTEAEQSTYSHDKIKLLEDLKKKLTDAKEKYNTLYTDFVLPKKDIDADERDTAIKLIERITRLDGIIDIYLSNIPNLLEQNRIHLEKHETTKAVARPPVPGLGPGAISMANTRIQRAKEMQKSVDLPPPSGSPATKRSRARLARSRERFPGTKSGGITKRKKYRRYNKRKTKHYKKKAKRYTKKHNRRY